MLLESRGPAITWRTATVAATRDETPRARTVVCDVPGWPGHIPGQHVDLRLTAEDGYQAERSYSIASAPGRDGLELTVELIDDGEVSSYLVGDVRASDVIELRGPIGGYFAWRGGDGRPLLLVGGGSGLVPLMSMLRDRDARADGTEARVLVSARSLDDLLYRDELDVLAATPATTVRTTLTRARPPGWEGFARRVDADMLAGLGPPPEQRPHVFVCGPTPFAESVASALVALGHDPADVHTERFGPTGG